MDGRILTERWIPAREPEKELRAAWGADSLVLGASRPLTRLSDAKGFAANDLVGGRQRSSFEPVSGEAGRLLLMEQGSAGFHIWNDNADP